MAQSCESGAQSTIHHPPPTRDKSITIAILNYRRWSDLRRVLASVYSLNPPPTEIILVDNASGPDFAPALRQFIKEQPIPCILIELPENLGVSARNRAIDASRGEIIVTLDNDMSFVGSSALRDIVDAFDRHPHAGCISFGIRDPMANMRGGRDWAHPWVYTEHDNRDRQTTFISEGACAFRRCVFDQVAGYRDALFINMEGSDLGFRLMDAGYEIWYAPLVQVYHSLSGETRGNGRDFYHNPRNLLLVAYRDVPLSGFFGFLAPRLLILAACSLLRGYPLKFAAGLYDGVLYILRTPRLRQPVRPETMERFSSLRKGAPGVLIRLRRHWKFVGRKEYHNQ